MALFPSKTQIEFLRAYHLSKHPTVQRMREIISNPRRLSVARALAPYFAIDPDIDAGFGDPYSFMWKRKVYGFSSVDSMATAGGAPGPAPIKTSTDLADYPAFTPARKFELFDFFRVSAALAEMGFVPQNTNQHMMLNGIDAADADPATDLHTVMEVTGANFEGALLHYGVILQLQRPGKSRVYDAEELSLVIPGGVDAVNDYLNSVV